MKKISLNFDPFMEWDAAIDFPHDCRRIQKAFAQKGYKVTELQASHLWSEHSENNFAGWLVLPSSDEVFDLLKDLWS